MLTALIHNIQTAANLLKGAARLAADLKKDFGIICHADNQQQAEFEQNNIRKYLSENNFVNVQLFVKAETKPLLADDCENIDASFLIIQLMDNSRKNIQKHLNLCRELRIPYVFFREEFPDFDLRKVMLPIGFLPEELEKAQFASAFGRFCGSEVLMLLANDYGSKAAVNAERMKELFDRFEFVYRQEKAKADSFKVEKEAVSRAEMEGYGMVIISASRDYGLDDLIFGPKELHLIRKSAVPLLIVNPRGDLYTLCD
ncbi:MAG: hypothetical protein H6Q19_222 [Bacteroidetes bacterium]|nr:hypothetical protein [Bacteroidota bacterium]